MIGSAAFLVNLNTSFVPYLSMTHAGITLLREAEKLKLLYWPLSEHTNHRPHIIMIAQSKTIQSSPSDSLSYGVINTSLVINKTYNCFIKFSSSTKTHLVSCKFQTNQWTFTRQNEPITCSGSLRLTNQRAEMMGRQRGQRSGRVMSASSTAFRPATAMLGMSIREVCLYLNLN